jgi:hypothetical protein
LKFRLHSLNTVGSSVPVAILPPPKKEEDIIIIYLNNYKGKRVSEKMSTMLVCLILLLNKENAAQVDLSTTTNKCVYTYL